MFDDSIPADGLLVADNNPPYQRSSRFLDKVRNVIRCKHYSIRTEQSYVDWIKRYIYFHKDVSTTMIYTHVLNKGGKGVKSPGDTLFDN